MAIIAKSNFVWGIQPLRILKGFPEGRIRLRLRNKAVAKAFVRTADGIRVFTIKSDGDWWVPGCELGRNLTTFSLQNDQPAAGSDGPQGPVGMPGPRGPNADGTLVETEEEHLQRWRDAITHNERFFASQNV